MKSITGNNTKQSGGMNLTLEQRAILTHFNSMDDDAQRCFMRMAESVALGSPRRHPKLRLVSGGAA